MPAALVSAHIEAQARLRTLAAAAVARAWAGLPNHDEASVAPFVAAVVPVVTAVQRQSITLADAFVARALGRRTLGIASGPAIDALRGDTTPADVYRRPFVTVWTALANGVPFEQALAAGAARATSLAEMDVQLAQRGGLQAIQRADRTIQGWRRVADPGACKFCAAVDGARLRTANAMALHDRCGCSIEPEVNAAAPTPLPDDVAVHEHGELGPTLGDPAHAFTGPGDIA